jgi:3-phenylpropionate/cinnamic acid dioxygenase small subunit
MEISRADAESFLYHEAYLLDSHSFEEWLKLFTDDCIYWLPMYDGVDPEVQASILYDDATMLRRRIYQLVNKPHYAQIPRSRTAHLISNVHVLPADREDEALVRCSLMVAELREGDFQQIGLGEQRLFAGRCEYRLRYDAGLAIAMKKLTLIQREIPIENLSFIL